MREHVFLLRVLVVSGAMLTLFSMFFFSPAASDCSRKELEAAKAKVVALQGQLRAAIRSRLTPPLRRSDTVTQATVTALENELASHNINEQLWSPSPPVPAPSHVHSSEKRVLQENATPAGSALGRHPRYRVALVVPWLGTEFPSWFPYFVESCRASEYLVDVLIFHESARLPDKAVPNVRFINVGDHGLGVIFGTALARLAGQENSTFAIVRAMQAIFKSYQYIVTEYKPSFGAVFEPYLTECAFPSTMYILLTMFAAKCCSQHSLSSHAGEQTVTARYSHWSYTDIDLVLGDLPRFIEATELQAS